MDINRFIILSQKIYIIDKRSVSSGLLRSEQCEILTDVSRKPMGLTLKGLFDP